jgi:2-desacetyl-2-hydroxyethyl bacteriochlorophyllide A dehydrogenase
MAKRIVFLDKGVVAFHDYEPGAVVPASHVRVRATTSLISTGTEGICLHRLFEPDTHWDHWVKYPFGPGYSLVGVISEVGPEADGFAVGQRVVARIQHRSESIAPVEVVYPIPDSISDADAAWFALVKIAFMGWKASEVKLGDDVLIVGAGPIGQCALRWILAAGARRVVVIDPVPMRLEVARKGGATDTIGLPVAESEEALREALGGRLPQIVVDTTGHAAVFAAALPLVADRGRFVILGDTGTPSDQRLTSDVIRRGLHVVGAHDAHDDARWHLKSITELFFSLVATGRFSLDGLNTHTFPAEACAEAYDLLTERRAETMGVRFIW